MTDSVIPYDPEHVKVFPGETEPRMRDTYWAERLGYAQARTIRRLIKAHLEKLNEISRVRFVLVPHPSGKKEENEEYWLTKAQAIYIGFKSNTPNAEALSVEGARVFDAFTSGKMVALEPAGFSGNAVIAIGQALTQLGEEMVQVQGDVAEIRAQQDADREVLLAVADQTGLNPGWYTVASYARKRDARLNGDKAREVGFTAKRISVAAGVWPRRVADARWGSVNSYKEEFISDAWHLVFPI